MEPHLPAVHFASQTGSEAEGRQGREDLRLVEWCRVGDTRSMQPDNPCLEIDNTSRALTHPHSDWRQKAALSQVVVRHRCFFLSQR